MNISICLLSILVLLAQENQIDTSGVDALLPAAEVAAPVAPEDTKPFTNDAGGAKAKPAAKSATGLSLTVLIHGGGVIGYTIILLSFISAALVIEHCLSIQRRNFAPRVFADEIQKLLQQGQFAPALQKCKEGNSILAQTLTESMPEFEFGWEAIEGKAEETMAEHANRYYRKIEYLNLIGNIAPMIGLLGTVVGMVIAFNQLSESEGYASAADLAGGIYIALVTTVQGLLVAIPALTAFSYFGNRIAALMSETAVAAERCLTPIKKGLLKKK